MTISTIQKKKCGLERFLSKVGKFRFGGHSGVSGCHEQVFFSYISKPPVFIPPPFRLPTKPDLINPRRGHRWEYNTPELLFGGGGIV